MTVTVQRLSILKCPLSLRFNGIAATMDNSQMIQVDIRPVWRFRNEGGERAFDFTLLAILEAVERVGKLSSAAGDAGISYRHAWSLVERWEEFLGAPLVTKAQGRGSSLTPLGERLLMAGRRAQTRLAPELENLAAEFSRSINESLHDGTTTLDLQASHDLALAGLRDLWVAEGMDFSLQYKGSFDALSALRRGECDVAGFHVPEGRFGTLMRRRYAESLPPGQFSVIEFVRRTQGLMVQPGNPKGIQWVADLCRSDVRMVNRQRGSGTRALLEFILSSEGLDRGLMRGYEAEEMTHGAVAALVAGRQADAGLGIHAAAALFRLDFVPLVVETYYLACRTGHLGSPPMRRLFEILRDSRFADLVAGLPGYTAPDPGRIVANLDESEAAATRTD
jgi:molybdate transport repressor ModE-like protein